MLSNLDIVIVLVKVENTRKLDKNISYLSLLKSNVQSNWTVIGFASFLQINQE